MFRSLQTMLWWIYLKFVLAYLYKSICNTGSKKWNCQVKLSNYVYFDIAKLPYQKVIQIFNPPPMQHLHNKKLCISLPISIHKHNFKILFLNGISESKHFSMFIGHLHFFTWHSFSNWLNRFWHIKILLSPRLHINLQWFSPNILITFFKLICNIF